jgi:GTP-sensing pleiotropic transcriptional regulator CodY
MRNFDVLYKAGLFPSSVNQESDLDFKVQATIESLSHEEISALTSIFNKLDGVAQNNASDGMRTASF